jgi:hypothetical protein
MASCASVTCGIFVGIDGRLLGPSLLVQVAFAIVCVSLAMFESLNKEHGLASPHRAFFFEILTGRPTLPPDKTG